LFTKGTLSGSFTATNTNTAGSLNIGPNSVKYQERSNNLTSVDLNATRTLISGSNPLPAASLSSTTTNQITSVNPPTPPGPAPASPACSGGWVAGTLIGNFQVWNCTTTTVTPSTATFSLSSAATSTNWSLIGTGSTYSVGNSFWSAPTVAIPTSVELLFTGFTPTAQSAQLALNGNSADNYLVYTYDYVNAQVPAPLPLVGAGLAFGFSRRLRLRIKSSASSAS
jgi:hypothetical protein